MLPKKCKIAKHLRVLHQRQFAEETLSKISSRKEFTSNSNFLEWQIFCNHRGDVSRRRFKRFGNSSPGLDSRVFVVGREWRDLPRILLSIWSKLKLIYSHFLLPFPTSCFYWAKLRMEIWELWHIISITSLRWSLWKLRQSINASHQHFLLLPISELELRILICNNHSNSGFGDHIFKKLTLCVYGLLNYQRF